MTLSPDKIQEYKSLYIYKKLNFILSFRHSSSFLLHLLLWLSLGEAMEAMEEAMEVVMEAMEVDMADTDMDVMAAQLKLNPPQ